MLQARVQYLVQAQRDVGIFSGIITGKLEFNLIEGFLLDPLTGNIHVMDGIVVEIIFCQRIHVMSARGRVEHVGLEHGVVGDAPHTNALADKNMCIVLDVLANLPNRGIFEQRFQCRQDFRLVELLGGVFIAVHERDITGLANFKTQ